MIGLKIGVRHKYLLDKLLVYSVECYQRNRDRCRRVISNQPNLRSTQCACSNDSSKYLTPTLYFNAHFHEKAQLPQDVLYCTFT